MSDATEIIKALRKQLALKSRAIKQYEQWFNALQPDVYANCAYCGHQYRLADKASVSLVEAMRQHIERCPKHPMSRLKADLARVMAERDAAVADLALVSSCRTCGNWTVWCDDNPDACKGYEWRGMQSPGAESDA